MALTASKSSGVAGRISTVVPSDSSAYTRPACCVVLMSAGRTGHDGIRGGVAEEVVDGDDALDVPDLAHQVMAKHDAFRAPGQGHHARLDAHRELIRVLEKPGHD